MSTLKVDAIRHNSATSDAITTASDGTCTAKLTSVGGGQLSHRNLVINGDMRIAQRATTSTSVSGYNTIDRMQGNSGGTDEAPTQAQVDVASGTTPYTLGFRKAFRFTNGNQTSGAGAGDYVHLKMVLEAQDIANSGWNYTSSSSFITLSFWVKSSVAQDFSVTLRTEDGTRQVYNMTTGSLAANTWTKIIKTIPGNSNLQFDDDVNAGLTLFINAFTGTTNTTTGLAQNTWSAWGSAKYAADMASTWYTTNDATFEFTGIQLEVGDTATTFEHRSYGEELRKCQRYVFLATVTGTTSEVTNRPVCMGMYYSSSDVRGIIDFPVQMRAAPSLTSSSVSNGFYIHRNNGADMFDGFGIWYASNNRANIRNHTQVSGTGGHAGMINQETGGSFLRFESEL